MTAIDSHEPYPEHFPWPFSADSYKYSANVEPAPQARTTAAGSWGATILDVDERYEMELTERARILAGDPGRSVELPHMRSASWEALDTILSLLASEFPQWMRYRRDGDTRQWTNTRLLSSVSFVIGDEASLGVPPLVFAASQVQEDIALLDQREDNLFVDAGVVTFASNWSLDFDAGMSFLEIHGPVPRNYADGAIPRALTFIKRLTPEQAYRRTNWTNTIGRRLDISLEKYADWGIDRSRIFDGDWGREFDLRVEVQHLLRLPQTNAVMFLIRTYFASLNQIAMVPGWAAQFASVIEHAPENMLAYKSFLKFKEPLLAWLHTHEHDAESQPSA